MWMSGVRKRLGDAPSPSGEVLTAVSDGLVALHRQYYGTDPTHAKAYYQDDLVVCLMRGGFTRVEQALQDAGQAEVVFHQRLAFHDVVREQFAAIVVRATGRAVIGLMSGYQQDPDLICEVFVLAPPEPRRRERTP